MDDMVERVLALFEEAPKEDPYKSACEIATNLLDVIRKGVQIEAIAQEVVRQMGCTGTPDRIRQAVEDVVGMHVANAGDAQVLPSFAKTLSRSRPPFGSSGMAELFRDWGTDIREEAERVWPIIAECVLRSHARAIFTELRNAWPTERKLFLALYERYRVDFICYPRSSSLRVNQSVSEISNYLRDQNQSAVFKEGDIDFEIDLFLYIGHNQEAARGRNVFCPFFVGIECDGHDFHERTKEQAAKDKSKVRTLKAKGLDVVRFTASEITHDLERCVNDIENLVAEHVRRNKRLLS